MITYSKTTYWSVFTASFSCSSLSTSDSDIYLACYNLRSQWVLQDLENTAVTADQIMTIVKTQRWASFAEVEVKTEED